MEIAASCCSSSSTLVFKAAIIRTRDVQAFSPKKQNLRNNNFFVQSCKLCTELPSNYNSSVIINNSKKKKQTRLCATAAPASSSLFMVKFAASLSLMRCLCYTWDLLSPSAKNSVIQNIQVCSSGIISLLQKVPGLLQKVRDGIIACRIEFYLFMAYCVKTKGWRYVYSDFVTAMMRDFDWISVKLAITNNIYVIKTEGWMYLVKAYGNLLKQELGWIADFAGVIWNVVLTGLYLKLWIHNVAIITTGELSYFLSAAGVASALLRLVSPYLSEMDSEDVDEKNTKLFTWDNERDDYFLKWLIKEVKNGKKTAGTFNEALHLQAACAVSEKFGTICTAKNVANRLKYHRKSYVVINKVMDDNGLSWDTIQKEASKKCSVYFPEIKEWLNRQICIYDQLAVVCSEEQANAGCFGKSYIDLDADPEKAQDTRHKTVAKMEMRYIR